MSVFIYIFSKKALSESDGDVDKALDWLRIQGVSTANKKSSQTAVNGFVCQIFNDNNNVASMIEVNCVTDFVENNPMFQKSVMNIANTIAYNETLKDNELNDLDAINELNVIDCDSHNETKQKVSESLTDIMSSIRENMVLRRVSRIECSNKGVIGSYLHSRKTDNLGMKGGLISLETDYNETDNIYENENIYDSLKELANNIATHLVNYKIYYVLLHKNFHEISYHIFRLPIHHNQHLSMNQRSHKRILSMK